MALDDFDRALLKHLQAECQTPLRELAERVHLSTASVQRRVQRLKAGDTSRRMWRCSTRTSWAR
ncbi:Lrp/AsnC family transcriptional regulator [Salinicola tamaricis]|uniref:Lrp/AsnC family transcriptional regulator n=1 Tax=Salinicola tamaricis TaxID=1771309 RepID=UPI001A9383C9|nr:Lrp/AsnC family transcriptional regulator [Salinicola tamaricis]